MRLEPSCLGTTIPEMCQTHKAPADLELPRPHLLWARFSFDVSTSLWRVVALSPSATEFVITILCSPHQMLLLSLCPVEFIYKKSNRSTETCYMYKSIYMYDSKSVSILMNIVLIAQVATRKSCNCQSQPLPCRTTRIQLFDFLKTL